MLYAVLWRCQLLREYLHTFAAQEVFTEYSQSWLVKTILMRCSKKLGSDYRALFFFARAKNMHYYERMKNPIIRGGFGNECQTAGENQEEVFD